MANAGRCSLQEGPGYPARGTPGPSRTHPLPVVAQARGRASSAAALPSATLAAEDCTFVAARGSVSLKPRAVKALFPDQFAVLSSNTAAAPSPGRCGSAAGPGSTPFPGPASAPSPALGPGTGTDSTPGPSMGPGSQAGSKVTVTLHVQAYDSGGLVPQDASLEVVANSTLHPLQPPWILSWRRLNGPLSALAAQPGTHLALSRNAEGRVVVDVFRARAKAATPGARATPAPSASAGLGRRLGVPTPGRPTASAGTGVTGRESAGKQNPGGGVGHSSDSSSGSEDEGGGGGDEGGAGPSRSAASPASAQRRRTSGPSAPGPGPDAPAAGEGRSGLPRDASDALEGSDGGALVTIALRNCLAMLEPHQLGMLLPETTAAEALSAQRAGGKYHHSVPLRLCAASAGGPHKATLVLQFGKLRLYFKAPTMQALNQPTVLRLRREGSALAVEALATAGAATVPALSPGAAAGGYMARGASACRATPGAGGQDATAATAERSPASGEAVASAAWRITESVFSAFQVYVPAASVSGLLRPFFESGAQQFTVEAQVTDEPGSEPKRLSFSISRKGTGPCRATGLTSWLKRRGAIVGDRLLVTRLPGGGLGLSLTKHDGTPRLRPLGASFDGQGGGTTSGGEGAEKDAHGQDDVEEESGGESSSNEEGPAGGEAPPPGASRHEATGPAASTGAGMTGREGVGKESSTRSGHTGDSSDSGESESEGEGSDDEGAAAGPSRSAASPASAQRRRTPGLAAPGPGPDAPTAGAAPSGMAVPPVCALAEGDTGVPVVEVALSKRLVILNLHQLHMLLSETTAAEALSAQRAGAKYHQSVPLRLCAAGARGAGPGEAFVSATQQPHTATLAVHCGALRLYFRTPTLQALGQPTALRLRREGSALVVEALATAGAATVPALSPGAAAGGCMARGASACRATPGAGGQDATAATAPRSPAGGEAVASAAWRIAESVFRSGVVYVPAASVSGLLRPFFDSGAHEFAVAAQVTDEPGSGPKYLRVKVRRQGDGTHRASGLKAWLRERGAIAGDLLVVTGLPGRGLGLSLTKHDGSPRLPPGRDCSEGQEGRLDSGGVAADEPNESSSDSGTETSSDEDGLPGSGAAPPSTRRPALPSRRTVAAVAVGATTPQQVALPGGRDLGAPASSMVPAAAGSGPSLAATRSAGPGALAGPSTAPAPAAMPGPGPGPSAAVEVGLAGSLAVLRPNEAQALGLRGAVGCYVQGALPLHIWPPGTGPNAGPGGCTAAVPLVRTVALVQQHGNLRLYLKQRVLDALGEALMIRLWREGDGLAVSSAPVPPTATAPHHVGPPHPHQPGKDTGGARADAPPVERGSKAARHDTPSLTPATATASWRLCMAALRYPRLDLPAAVVRGPLRGFLSTEESVRLDVAVEDEPGRTLKLRVKKVSKYHAYRAGGLQAFFVKRDARVGDLVTLTRRPDGGLTLRLTRGEGGSAGASGSAGEAEEPMTRGKRYKSLTDLHAAAPEEGHKRARRRSLGDVGQQRTGDQAEAEPQEQARSPQQQPQQEGAAAEGQVRAGEAKPAGVKRETGPILPASFLSAAHLQGCALSHDAVPPPALQPGELRLCGLTFHPELAPGVRSAMEAWEARLAEQLAAEGLDGGLADALPEKLQIRILDPAARDLLKAAGIRTYMVTCHLSCLLGLSAYFDAPLPEHAPQLGPSFLAPGPDEGRGGAGLFAAAALRKGAVLGVLGGYVMPKAAARRHLIRGFQALSDEAKAELSARAARGAGRGPEEGQAASGGDVPSRYAWQLLEGSFHLPMPGSPDGWELSMLGYGSLAALINDPRQEPTGRVEGSDVGEEGGAAAAGANCAVVPVSVRGLTLPVVVALRGIQPGEQLLRDYGADWWAAFNKGSWNFASLSWQLRTEAVLHAEGALAALRKPAVEGEAAEGAGTH
ncbi:hypothetical protein HYH03_006451 [Edaphochlamys debaryana]|uniref:Uncharacterized protein n=1 Tax=Edaphochlamys debaryana TaxID=47281 RepID=A0A836C1D9_9CHLO|nr:hypothetical protein HYH03_006451 [Edaphochlamys debaryana]|eukprot:KAG2495508.1 hypothetical protein HYH03_006451 [Edaphochlamys debaryana]